MGGAAFLVYGENKEKNEMKIKVLSFAYSLFTFLYASLLVCGY